MESFIVGIAVFALFMSHLYRDHKNKERKQHEDWIYDCRQCLAGISRSFRRDCQSLAEKAFVQYSAIMQNGSYKHMPDNLIYYFLSDYRKEIDALKEDYTENIIKKLNDAMGSTTVTRIPNYLIEEYRKQLSDIYCSFIDFAYLMRKQLAEANEKHMSMLLEGR